MQPDKKIVATATQKMFVRMIYTKAGHRRPGQAAPPLSLSWFLPHTICSTFIFFKRQKKIKELLGCP
jgi:hypothetical protein